MRKPVSLLAALALVLSLTSGCSLASETQAATQTEPESLPEGYTQVYGKIKSASGNEILLVMGTPGGGGGQGMSGPLAGGDASVPAEEAASDGTSGAASGISAAAGELSAEGRQRSSRGGGETPDTATLPGGSTEGTGPDAAGFSLPGGVEAAASSGSGEAGSGSGRRQSGAGGARSESTTLTYTGEEELFLIPVTATITSGQGENARAVRFTQLAVKNVVKLTLDGNDSIVSVQIIG